MLPARSIHFPRFSSLRRGTAFRMVNASTTACIVAFPFDGEGISRIRDKAHSMLGDMKRADTDTWKSFGSLLQRVLAGVTLQRNCGDAAQLQAVPTDIGNPDADAVQAGIAQAQAPRLRERAADAQGERAAAKVLSPRGDATGGEKVGAAVSRGEDSSPGVARDDRGEVRDNTIQTQVASEHPRIRRAGGADCPALKVPPASHAIPATTSSANARPPCFLAMEYR